MMVYTILFLYVYFALVKIIKSKKDLKKGEEILNIFGAFAKPQRVTEEEVSISKEKKICLVCKGKVSGINFICRQCESFYCEKCYTALTDLENVCWACDTALDETKPVKPFISKEEVIDLEISEKPQKKPNINQKSGGEMK